MMLEPAEPSLTGKELKVVCLYVLGYSFKEMAAEIGTTHKVCENAISSARDKLGVVSRRELMAWAAQRGVCTCRDCGP